VLSTLQSRNGALVYMLLLTVKAFGGYLNKDSSLTDNVDICMLIADFLL